MPLEGPYEPSPQDYVANQVATYERTGGQEGNTMRGVPVIILWTRGRSSGAVRKTPLMRVEHDGRYAVVASQGGAPTHPAWYRNMTADPHVSLQDGPEVRDFVAREVTGEEKSQWWARATEVWPDYDAYQAKTDREIPLLVLEPASG
jgi:F420H(2)-dependent quinone reductase